MYIFHISGYAGEKHYRYINKRRNVNIGMQNIILDRQETFFHIVHTCGCPGTNVRQHWHPSLISFGTSGRHRRATRTGITLTSSFDMFKISERKHDQLSSAKQEVTQYI